jgi:hypothetical protein
MAVWPEGDRAGVEEIVILSVPHFLSGNRPFASGKWTASLLRGEHRGNGCWSIEGPPNIIRTISKVDNLESYARTAFHLRSVPAESGQRETLIWTRGLSMIGERISALSASVTGDGHPVGVP